MIRKATMSVILGACLLASAALERDARGDEPKPRKKTTRPPAGYVVIPAGRGMIGTPLDEPGRLEAEREPELVTFDKPFYLKRTPVTVGEWRAVMGAAPNLFTAASDKIPVTFISFYDAAAFLNAMSRSEGLEECYGLEQCTGMPNSGCTEAEAAQGGCTGHYRCKIWGFRPTCNGYRFPTTNEWEYAARAGSRTSTYAGTPEILGRWNSPLLETIAWYGGNSRTDFTSGFRVSCAKREGTEVPMQQCGPQPVGQKQPNAWGLHDMIGNVMQHTYDSKIAGMRIRGCSWFDEAIECRVGYPATLTYEQRQMVVGLRPARDIP